jgi:large subunit ribosomal protein L25
MSEVNLLVKAGRTPGSRESRRIRLTGQIPAIVYGKGVPEPVPVSVDARDLHNALHTEAGSNAIISLEIEGRDILTTMARVIERHPFRSEYRHIDFVTVDLTQTVIAEVNIQFEGAPVGVREGGVFSPRRTTVVIEVLPTEIPAFIELDVSDVELNESLRIEDLPELEGIVYTEDPEAVIMSVTVPAAEIEEEEPELTEEELAELEELEDGEAEEGAEGEDEEETEDSE